MRRLLVCCVFIGLAAAARAAEYQRLLVPVNVFNAPGAFGTIWSTRVVAVQELEDGVRIIGVFGELPGSIGRSQPHGIALPPSQNEPPGSILYVPQHASAAVHVSARVVLRRPAGEVEETFIPVVPADQFVARTLYFPQLTKSSTERVWLRAYSLDVNRSTAAIRARVQATWVGAIGGWRFIYDAVHPLAVRQRYESVGGESFALRPLALELSIDPILDTLPEGAEVAVSVLPASDDLRIWAMVSETHNVTQRVRVTQPAQ